MLLYPIKGAERTKFALTKKTTSHYKNITEFIEI